MVHAYIIIKKSDMHVVWNMILCGVLSSSCSFEWLQCLHFQGQAVQEEFVYYDPSKHQEILSQLHTLTSQKIWIFSNTTVTASNSTVLKATDLNWNMKEIRKG